MRRFDVWNFRRKPKQRPIERNFTGAPPRSGKTRISSRKTGAATRRFNKRTSKLRNSGFKMASSKPLNHLSDAEFRKFDKKIQSGKYEVRTLLSPPKWKGEAPREWVMLRRRK